MTPAQRLLARCDDREYNPSLALRRYVVTVTETPRRTTTTALNNGHFNRTLIVRNAQHILFRSVAAVTHKNARFRHLCR